MTNHAEFHGHTALQGASAFLVRTQDGRTLAATAKHLLGQNGGVDPEVSVVALDGAIRSWRLFPRTLEDQFVEAGKVAAPGLDDPKLDWLLLTLKDTGKPLPATPLRLRPRPVEVGEDIYLVGCPYIEEPCKQNVYAGKVTARNGHRFRYDVDPPVDLRGFSGAPAIDRAGHVVGVIMLWFQPRKQDEKFLEAGGEDAASVYPRVEPRR
ncbi:S1 family peptidase [Sorangium cellulosum]|uniref:S1 family peptidase n=1 Tax=Sorangium cellulosum TaxID=56 RepID=UPI0013312B31|nr:serine protease [Sorangium cellulosum]